MQISRRIRLSRFLWILLAFVAYFGILGFELSTSVSVLTAAADPAHAADEPQNHEVLTASIEKVQLKRPRLPIGYRPTWTTTTLDDDIHVEVLETPFGLKETENHLGSEYFSYSTYLFSQIAAQVDDAETAATMQSLINSSQELRTLIGRSGKTWFDGTPTANMEHLQIRSYIMGNLNQLNSGAIHRVDYSLKGEFRDYDSARQPKEPGKALQKFLNTLHTLQQSTFAQSHPQTFALISRQAQFLNKLAMNMELRWESRLMCDALGSSDCNRRAVRMRIYAVQSLKPEHPPMVTTSLWSKVD